jgi:hypothetical protein
MYFFERLYRYYSPKWLKIMYRSKFKYKKEYQQFCTTPIEELQNYQEVWNFVRKTKNVPPVPYEWFYDYRPSMYKMHRDEKGYYCNLLDNKKLYFPDKLGVNGRGSVMAAMVMAEQDARSPHLYFSDNVYCDSNTVLFDIGGQKA